MTDEGDSPYAQDAPVPAAPAPVAGPTQDEKTMALLVHIIGIVGLPGFIASLVIWLVKKDESPFIDRHGRAAVNWFISVFIYSVISAVLIFVLIGIPLVLAILVLHLVFVILNTVNASNGQEAHYPLAIPFVG